MADVIAPSRSVKVGPMVAVRESVRVRLDEAARKLGNSGAGTLTPAELGLDERSFRAGEMVGRVKVLQELDEVIRLADRPTKRGMLGRPDGTAIEEEAEFVNTTRASEIIGRSYSTMTKWSMAGRSPCGTVIPYTDPRDKRVVLWKVAELRDYLRLGDGAQKANAAVEPRRVRVKKKISSLVKASDLVAPGSEGGKK
jgi:hypothetical protein